MSSTYSTNLALELIGTGDQAGNWGSTTNTNLGTLIEQAISGYTTYSCTGGTDTLTMTNGASATARNMYLELTGTGGGTLVVPGTSPNANKKLYFVYNNTSSAITVKVSGQTGVSVPAAAKIILVCNGTDIVVAENYMASLTLGTPLAAAQGGTGVTTSTGTGNNVLSASPTFTGVPIAPTASAGTNTTQIATTAFVAAATGTLGTMSTQNANAVAITGGTVSGLSSLSVSGTATATTFSGAGTSLTGTAASLSIGGNAATATDATNILGSSSQSYQNVIGSRAINTTYTNSTGKPIWVAVAWTATGNGSYTATVNGNQAYYTTQDLYPRANVNFIVPNGNTYSVSSSAGQTPAYWFELR